MMIEHRGIRLYVDRILFKNFKIAVEDAAKKRRDVVILVAGPERVGKSYGVKQFGFIIDYILYTYHGIDKPFTNDNIHFGVRDYMAARERAEDAGETNRTDVNDESKTDLDRKNRYADEYRDFENYLAYCGSEYGIHFILLPLWSDIGDYIILHRATYVIEFYSKRNKKTGDIEKGYWKLTSIPYTDDVKIRGKTKAEIKEIISWRYKHKRFSPLPRAITALQGRCLKGEVVSEAEYERKKRQKKKEYIHKKNSNNVIGYLTKAERETVSKMPICEMYGAKTKEYRCLLRLQKKCQKTTDDR